MQTDRTKVFEPELEEALAAFATSRQMHRDDAMRQILRDWLLNEGYLHSGDQGIQPEKLNASNDD